MKDITKERKPKKFGTFWWYRRYDPVTDRIVWVLFKRIVNDRFGIETCVTVENIAEAARQIKMAKQELKLRAKI
jgi:hypothetical protein